jgi:hypothetical protein
MRHRLPLALAALALAVTALPAAALDRPGLLPAAGDQAPTVRAGVGVVDATWNVGAAAGQYSAANSSLVENVGTGGDVDPHGHSRIKEKSYGTHSRLTVRAIVVEGTDGNRIALLKSDNYLAQDLLLRRAGQLLDEGDSGVGTNDILHAASHNHSSPYYTTTSPGVFVFQDVFDQRMFEYQARAIRDAIELAARDLRPATMAATTVPFDVMKGNVVGPALADDGTPPGYPREYGDTGLVVMRFDELLPGKGKKAKPRQGAPIAVWMNFGEHPESLDGYGLTTSDYLGPLERFVERDLGRPARLQPGRRGQRRGPVRAPRDPAPAARRHPARLRARRLRPDGARRPADGRRRRRRVRAGRHRAGPGAGVQQLPRPGHDEVGPRPDQPALPDRRQLPHGADRRGRPRRGHGAGLHAPRHADVENPVVNNLELHGVPVPDHYAAPGYPAVEENTRLKLQVFRLGEVLLASCACEAQVDLILNLESRANDVAGDIVDGYDWGQHCTQREDTRWDCRTPAATGGVTTVSDAAYQRMQAQVHNDAAGWDDPSYATQANSEPADPALIKGNFTKEELTPERGFALPVGIGHAGDYNGYAVSYREYMSRDSYRKALTTYGPHTTDYMATRLVRMAGASRAARRSLRRSTTCRRRPTRPARWRRPRRSAAPPARRTTPGAPRCPPTSGRSSRWSSRPTWSASRRRPSAGAAAPTPSTTRSPGWSGSSTAAWRPYADMSGEVQTTVEFPDGVEGVANTHTGRQEWRWTASFEAFDAFPARIGSTPAGDYRFVVDGVSRTSGSDAPYALTSEPFRVAPWTGVQVTDGQVGPDGSASFVVPAVAYPRTYASAFRTIRDDGRETICRTCTFRPWAATADVVSATVTVQRAGGAVEQVPATLVDGRWTAATALAPGDRAVVAPGGVRDAGGNTNGQQLVLAG